MATSFLDVASDALTSIGQLGVGQSISPEQSNQCLRVANRMLGKWNTRRLYLFNVPLVPFTLTPLKQDYTIGPMGADFTQARPTFVQGAQIALPGSAMSGTLNLLDVNQWGTIQDKGAICSALGLPQDMWVEYSFPNLGFHLWTIPSNAAVVTMELWISLTKFVTVFDVFSFPEGYEEAIIHNLAMELCPYYDMPVPEALSALAADGLAAIQGINAQSLGGALGETRTLSAPAEMAPPQGAK